MARTRGFRDKDRIVGGKLETLLRSWRTVEGLSFESIARRLDRDYDVDVSGETVRTWCRTLGVDAERRAS